MPIAPFAPALPAPAEVEGDEEAVEVITTTLGFDAPPAPPALAPAPPPGATTLAVGGTLAVIVTLTVGVPRAVPVALAVPVAPGGGGTEETAPTSEPVPQGILDPSG